MQVDDNILDKLRDAYLSMKRFEDDAWRILHEQGRGIETDFDQMMKALALLFDE